MDFCSRAGQPGSKTIPPHENPRLFVNVYVNWYVRNGTVLIPKFGDPPADAAARDLVCGLYPHREVIQLTINNLAEGGGASTAPPSHSPPYRARQRRMYFPRPRSPLSVISPAGRVTRRGPGSGE
jgi:hypothetical protein